VSLCLQKYHDLDVEVIRKDGLILIREMAAEVKNMMDIKMNAVMVSLSRQFLLLHPIKTKLRGLSPRANYTSERQLLVGEVSAKPLC
jgi:hypothetical protein